MSGKLIDCWHVNVNDLIIAEQKEKSMTVCVEVGANNGRHTRGFANEFDLVITFEPNPELLEELYRDFKDSNVIVLPFAVDIDNGLGNFNIASVGDRGYSSLYDYHSGLLDSPLGKHSVYQAGFQSKKLVPKVRLDTILNMLNIDKVDYLHVDAQGNDLNVLKSLGSKVYDVRAGIGEFTYKVPIYENDWSNKAEYAMVFLTEMGFQHKIVYTHADEAEVDISFWREE